MKTLQEIYKKLYEECYHACNIVDIDKRRRYANIFAVKNTQINWRKQYDTNK
jgi:hypothetical protein